MSAENQEKARSAMDFLHRMEATSTPTRDDLATHAPELLEAVQLAYRKHHLGDESIGWDELSKKLGNTLSNAMGPGGYLAWMQPYGSQEDA